MRHVMLVMGLLSLETCLAQSAPRVELKTSDGFSLEFEAQSGRIEAIRGAGQTLPLKDASFPLRVWEFTSAPNLVPNSGFEEDIAAPRSGSPVEGTVRVTDFNHTQGGRYCGKVSAPVGRSDSPPANGSSVPPVITISVKPHRAYRWSAWGLVPAGTSGGNVVATELDAQGLIILGDKGAMRHVLSWAGVSSGAKDEASATKQTYESAAEAPGRWCKKESTFVTTPTCVRIRVDAGIWNGHGDFYFDDLELIDCDSLWRRLVVPPAPLRADDATGVYSQQLYLPDEGLEFQIKYTAHPDHIRVETVIQDVSHPMRERGLRVEYVLPINLAGWTWHDDGRQSRGIEPNGPAIDNAFEIGGGRTSKYPFTSVTKGNIGISLAAPMDEPRLQNFVADPAEGYLTTVNIGLSPDTKRIGAGRARFVTLLSGHDGNWGLRAAAKKYYQMQPNLFVKRVQRGGMWFRLMSDGSITSVPHLEDFGARFGEGFPADPKTRQSIRALGVSIFPYTSPSGIVQPLPDINAVDQVPPVEERLKLLRDWAADKQSPAKWLSGPRWLGAQATLNSLPYDADGNPCAWQVITNYGGLLLWWKTNTNPNLPQPNRAIFWKECEVDPVLSEADGIYIDSVVTSGNGYLNFRQEHFADAESPLVCDLRSGRPALLGLISFTDFMAWAANNLHVQGKLVLMNIFSPTACRFCANLTDVMGCEVGTFGRRNVPDMGRTDEGDLIRRTLAYQKPVCLLLQESSFGPTVPEVSHDEVVAYLKKCLFYGFFPGISAIGGEEKPGWKNWKRYFATPAQYERDRAEFKKVVAALQELDAAGWEPVPFARVSPKTVFLERFGYWDRNNLYYTLYNTGDKQERATVVIEPAGLGAAAGDWSRVSVRDVLSKSLVPTTEQKNGNGQFSLDLAARDTAVLRIER